MLGIAIAFGCVLVWQTAGQVQVSAALRTSESPSSSPTVARSAALAQNPGSTRPPGQPTQVPSGTPLAGQPEPTSEATDAQPTEGSAILARDWEGGAGIAFEPALAQRLDRALVGVPGQVGLVVKDLGSGRGAVLSGDAEMPAASLFKLSVLYSVFEANVPLSEELTLSDEILSYDLGTMELGPGEQLSVAEALERMVTISDNSSAILLANRVGGVRINANLAALGMPATHYSAERMNTSALDMEHLLELIARGKAVSPAASADMVHLLLRQRINDRIPSLLPNGVQAAHKTGNLPGTVNDVGILYGPGRTVIVAGLVSDTPDEASAASAIARAASAAYDYFAVGDGQPGPTIPPAPNRPIPPVWREPSPPAPTPTPRPELSPTAALVARRASPTPTEATAAEDSPAAVVATPAAPPPTTAPTRAPATPTVVVAPAAKPAVQSAPAPTRTPTAPPNPFRR